MSQGLKAVTGVIDADVSFDEQRAEVRYRPDLVAPPALVKAVQDAGFEARLLQDSDAGRDGAKVPEGAETAGGAARRERNGESQ